MRHTRAHTNNRRSHHALQAASVLADKESGALRLPHRLDESTGMYRGKQILPKKVMKAKAEHDKKVEKAKHEHDRPEYHNEPVVADKEAQIEAKKGLVGRMTKGKAKARSGMGGSA